MKKTFVDDFFVKNNIKYVKIRVELLQLISKKHQKANVDDDIFAFLDSLFDQLLEKSFNEQIVFYNADGLVDDVLIAIHCYFRKKCCNIQNITFLSSTSGLKNFYNEYCKLNRTIGMKIVEIPMIDQNTLGYIENIIEKKINKKISKLFSFYGGSYDTDPPERTFWSLFASQYKDHGTIEMIGKCGTLSNLENWLEYETFFKDAKFVEKYKELYKKYIDNNSTLSKELISINPKINVVLNERFGQGDYQELVDSQCFLNLIRETVSLERFAFISEKTFRCFYNHTIPLPITGKFLIEDLKSYGFWFPEELIDYSYLTQDIFSNRIKELENVLDKLILMSHNDYQIFYQKNIDNFKHNQRLVVSWKKIIEKELQEKIIK